MHRIIPQQYRFIFIKLSTAVLILLWFSIIYLLSFSAVYIEGDDASIVSYHVLGRDSHIQPPYAAYMSMFDFLLSALPASEGVVRMAAAVGTAVCGPLFFYLIILLAFDWNPDIRSSAEWVTTLAILLAVPELFYMALVINPSLVAMTIITAAHLLIRRASYGCVSPPVKFVAASSFLFGLGAALRWDCVLYGGIIAADLFLRAGDRGERPFSWRQRLRLAIIWGALAASCWFVAIVASRGGFSGLLSVLEQSGPGESLDPKMFIVRSQPLFTPAFLILAIVGFISACRSGKKLMWITPLSLLLTAGLIGHGVPKWFIVSIPALMACAVAGFAVLATHKPVVRAALAGLLLLPWLIGIRVTMAGSTLGPGFQVNRYDHAHKTGSMPSVALGSGVAIPTPEGPRPLWGHLWVLSGQWRTFTVEADSELKRAIREAIERNLPLLQDRGQGLVVASTAALGLTTADPAERDRSYHFEVDRRFAAPDGRTFRMIRLKDRRQLYSAEGREQLHRLVGSSTVIYGYSSTLVRIYQSAPDILEPLGITTALLDLGIRTK